VPRRLGIGGAPAQGESFPSWVDRMAVRMRIGPAGSFASLGWKLLPGGISVVLPVNYGISMSRGDLEAVRSATGSPQMPWTGCCCRCMTARSWTCRRWVTVLQAARLGRGSRLRPRCPVAASGRTLFLPARPGGSGGSGRGA